MTDHHDGAVGVTDDGVGNAAHQCPSHPVESPAARRYQVCLQFFGQVNYGLIGSPHPQVRLRHPWPWRPSCVPPWFVAAVRFFLVPFVLNTIAVYFGVIAERYLPEED